MDSSTLMQFKDLGLGAILGLSALGSAMGVGVAGPAAVGAWKKGFLKNKPTPFLPLLAFIGAPLSQTFYGMIVMNQMINVVNKGMLVWFIGLFSGAVIGWSAYMQGRIGAAAADAMGESEKGFTNYIAALGIIESVAVFVMVFTIQILGKLSAV